MPEYRVEGLSAAGKPVQGIIEAENTRAAKQKAEQMAAQRKFKLLRLLPRATFMYKVQRGAEKPVMGEQKAFTREEVQDALSKMGFRVISVKKKLFDLKMKPPTAEIVTFVRVSADLIRQKLPYNEILQLMVNDITNKTLRDAIKEINNELKQGKDSEKVFIKQEAILGRFTAHMLGLASKSGNMAEIYDSTAKFLERRAEFKKNLKSALIMPTVTLIALFGACIYYVGFIFPSMAEVFVRLKVDMHQFPMTYATLQFSYFLQEYFVILLICTIVPVLFAVRFFTTERGRFFRDKYIWKVPIIGPLLHKTSIEIFCRVFYALYSGAGENIDVIKMAAEACGNKYMEHQVKTVAIPMMVEKGAGITEAFEASGVFTKTAVSRFHSGAETGTVKHTALQLAEYYEKETSYKMRNAIDFIQLWISLIIMIVLTLLTLVSSETATFHPSTAPGAN
ncbi:MAG: type II secretion system F family protein [Ignavibacteriae bacterium]|nr:type II secretion system F family protein [Ignavibacteria bacterium]MBI3364594.1 type II secretion system F family protein [Ignavibacteriota bacterium]